MINFNEVKSLCFLALLSSAALDCTKAAAQDATAYKLACGECHPAAAVIARKIRGGGTEDEKRAYLINLIQGHHPPDPTMIDNVIGYILALPKK
jgi:hypothetical protein